MTPSEKEKSASALAQLLATDCVGFMIDEINDAVLRDLMGKTLGRLIELRADARDEARL